MADYNEWNKLTPPSPGEIDAENLRKYALDNKFKVHYFTGNSSKRGWECPDCSCLIMDPRKHGRCKNSN